MFKHQTIEKINIKSKTGPNGRFYEVKEGIKYPSITTVLGSTGDKQWLEDWKQMLGPKKANKESKRCADRGTAVHKLCEDYLNNEEDFTDPHNIVDIKLFNKLKFKLKNIDNIKALEIALFSDVLGIAGRTDCVAEYNGVLSIIDFKTSNNIKPLENIEDYYLQAAFYMIAYNEMYNANITQLVILIAVEKSIMSQAIVKTIDKKMITELLLKIKQYKVK